MPVPTDGSRVVLAEVSADAERPRRVYRLAGDEYVLLEYGEMELDLMLNFRVQAVDQRLQELQLPGIIETVPGFRSILVHYDFRKISLEDLLDKLEEVEKEVGSPKNLKIRSRIIELPVAFRDSQTTDAIQRYVKYVRSDAPNVINNHNIDYIARYNGLSSAEEVMAYIEATEWWNACLGFWAGLPFLFPLDPRYALIAPKYNPTRPWTPSEAVGIGGPCIAIYPVASGGGYQLLGRTLPVYDPERRNDTFRENPILMRQADRVRFFRVTEEELDRLTQEVYENRYRYRIHADEVFDVGAYLAFIESIAEEIKAFRARQQAAAEQTPVP